MRFYAGLTSLLCSPDLVLRRRSWSSKDRVMLYSRHIIRVGGNDTTLSNDDYNATDWELVPEISDANL